MSDRAQRICLWCGPIFLALFGIGLVPLAGFLPPPAANDTAQEVVKLYTEHNDRLQAGLVLMLVSLGFLGPWVGLVSAHIRRIEQRIPALTYGQLASGAGQIIVIMAPIMFMIAASFRPERDPQVTQTLHDLAWIWFVMNFPLLAAQMAIVGIATFLDHDQHVFPRWFGYFNVWCVVLLFPAVLIPFFKSGAFAWQGIFEFWLAALVFFGWMTVMTIVLARAIGGVSVPRAGH